MDIIEFNLVQAYTYVDRSRRRLALLRPKEYPGLGDSLCDVSERLKPIIDRCREEIRREKRDE